MRSTPILTAATVLLLAACGGGGQAADPTPAGSAPAAPATTSAGDTITGTLGGDAQLEGGCAWVDDGKTRWQVEYPAGYTLTFDPLTLTGPDGATASAGDTVTVTGAERPDTMTICQVGPVWAATGVSFGE